MKKNISLFLNILFFLHVFLAFLVIFESFLEIPFWLQPLGRMHPLLLHFPVAFIMLLVLLNLFRRHIEPNSFKKLNYLLLLLTSFTTVLATIMGLLLSHEGYESQLMLLHKWIGIGLCFIIYALIWFANSQKVYMVLLYSGFVGVIFGGHFGAGLTHGSQFITEPITTAFKEPLDDSTPIYAAYIAPILDEKCTSCHNSKKKKGGLDLSSLEGITKGGENGELWLAHNPRASLFFERTSLPLEDEEHMPPEGKPQLSERELELIETWVRQGADTEISFALLKKEDSLKQLIGNKWRERDSENSSIYKFDFADASLIQKLNTPYRTVVQIAPSSPAIEVAVYGRSVYKEELLLELANIKEQIVYLNLSYMPIGDKGLEFVGQLKNLEHLVLNFTDISSEALANLASNTKLQSLSLAGTAIDSSVLEYLQYIKDLKELFVWNTQMTKADIEHLSSKLPNVILHEGHVPESTEKLSLTPPTLAGEKNIITSGDLIALEHKMPGVEIRYTMDKTLTDENYQLFKSPIPLELQGKRSVTIKAIAIKEGWLPSKEVNFTFYDKGIIPDSLEVVHPGLLSDYTGRSAKILTDDVRNNAKTYYYSKFWAAFKSKPLIAIANFGMSNPGIKEVVLSCGIPNKAKKSPVKYVEVWSSDNKEDWNLVKRKNFEDETNMDQLKEISLQFPESSMRYYKIVGQPNEKSTMRVNQLFFH